MKKREIVNKVFFRRMGRGFGERRLGERGFVCLCVCVCVFFIGKNYILFVLVFLRLF